MIRVLEFLCAILIFFCNAVGTERVLIREKVREISRWGWHRPRPRTLPTWPDRLSPSPSPSQRTAPTPAMFVSASSKAWGFRLQARPW